MPRRDEDFSSFSSLSGAPSLRLVQSSVGWLGHVQYYTRSFAFYARALLPLGVCQSITERQRKIERERERERERELDEVACHFFIFFFRASPETYGLRLNTFFSSVRVSPSLFPPFLLSSLAPHPFVFSRLAVAQDFCKTTASCAEGLLKFLSRCIVE